MYQSGTAPELMLPGWDGPISQTGLICATVPSRTRVAQVNSSSGSSRTRRGPRSRGHRSRGRKLTRSSAPAMAGRTRMCTQ